MKGCMIERRFKKNMAPIVVPAFIMYKVSNTHTLYNRLIGADSKILFIKK